MRFKRLAEHVGDGVGMGFHFCSGDLGHEHYLEPKDLGVCVELANLVVESLGRKVD